MNSPITIEWKYLDTLSFIDDNGTAVDIIIVNYKNRNSMKKYISEKCEHIKDNVYYFRGQGLIKPAIQILIDNEKPLLPIDRYIDRHIDKNEINLVDLLVVIKSNKLTLNNLTGIDFKISGKIHQMMCMGGIVPFDKNVKTLEELVINLHQYVYKAEKNGQ